MRILSAVVFSALLLSGTWGYTKFADSVRREPVEIQSKLDDASWRIRITRTFDCVPDPDSKIASLNVQLKRVDVFKSDVLIPVNAAVEIGPIPEIEQGDNELFIAANLARQDDFDFDWDQQHALRVQIFRGDKLVKDESIWPQLGGTLVEETVLFQAPRQETQHTHDHN